ncbi:DUF58 domain-containing protein [Halomicrobium salinisoli]|uniref:DUF58 domain-containing protein n=1 Tax=Halomicrobium salinisoli TaxID=2878391 RepID=UPI001CEFFF71|nr:DUF58 domain-containing protein [Halomicrobium salinisoli]
MTLEAVSHRDVGLSVALVAGAAGVTTSQPVLLSAAAVGLVYAAYEAATPAPRPDLTLERTLSTASPMPGERVEVTVAVTNDGAAPLHDVRLVDGVPSRLAVVEGSPRFGTALEPGERATFSYAVRARRGDHAFGETTVVCRSLSGDEEVRETVRADSELSCRVTVDEVSPGTQTLPYPGRNEADDPGEGVSFYGVREYESTDSMRRVDWKRFARTGELTAVQYEARRSAAVVVLVDARLEFARTDRSPTATQFAKYAAERVGTALLDGDDRVGAALYDDGAYLAPGTGRTQALRLRRLLIHEAHPDAAPSDGAATAAGFDGRVFLYGASGDGPSIGRGARRGPTDVPELHQRLPDRAQVLFCSPLLDDEAADVAAALSARDRDVTVVSPDLTSDETPGNAVERIERRERIDRVRRIGRVVDWDVDAPLPRAIERATERWSR